MKIKYDVARLQKIIADLTVLTGISMAVMDMEHNYLCSYPNNQIFCDAIQKGGNAALCHCDDTTLYERSRKSGGFESHICHAGLFDAVMPIKKNGMVVAYIFFGRVRTSACPGKIFPDGVELKALYDQVPVLSEMQIQSLKSLLPEVLFENAIVFEFDEMAEMLVDYIQNHLQEDLSVEAICNRFFISKNSLYKLFRIHYDCTITEFIIQKRLEKAKQMLRETSTSVYIIAETVGIHNYTYFCRLFKQKVGISPVQYRKGQNG